MAKIKAFIKLARPHQYLKNGFIFLPLFFGHKLVDEQALLTTLFAFAVFCLAASSVYVVNDLKDVEEDRLHPTKKDRPLASGALSRREAAVFAAVLCFSSLSLSALLGLSATLILVAYLSINLAYSFYLKHIAIIDVAVVAVGFVLRIFFGGIAASVSVSHWLVLITFLLALFIALAKRRDDLVLAAQGKNTRRCLDGYCLEFVSQSMVIMAAVFVVSYILYTLSPEVVAKHGTDKLYLTVLFVIVGFLRYMQITVVEERSGAPTMLLMEDRFLQLVILAWAVGVFVVLYALG